MTVIIQRTWTEVLSEAERQRREPASGPLEALRQEPAYVLLGDPGSGKSTAFRTETKALGSQAKLVSARDFLTLNVDSHPEWQGPVLFIDGLDEMRVGSGDRRQALDNIRSRLEILGCPRFRISCREADWLGENDRSRLEAVVQDGRVAVARLDPLTDADVERVLNAHPAVDDPHQFVADAKDNRVDGLLNNPLTLDLLAKAVGGGHGWPESRLRTFEMACRQMATEFNEEHVAAGPPPHPEQLLHMAGLLCAHLLISGAAGCSINYHETDADYIHLDHSDDGTSLTEQRVLATRLFSSVGSGRFVPAHRHIAEFLGARYLTQLVDGGLPVARILAMITAGDGVVVTVLRGLSAWLAALCPDAREQLIDSDPVGVGLYGDLQGFSVENKSRLLLAMNREVADHGVHASAFGALASSDMECTLRGFLQDQRRDTDHQLVTEFLLRVLQDGPPLTGLFPELLQAVHDDSRWPRVTAAALNALIHISAALPDGTEQLKQLLGEIESGEIADPDNELLGKLLARLYPRGILPSQIWGHLVDKGNVDLIGAYFAFWHWRLLQRSSDGDVAELLDGLGRLMPDLRATFRVYHLENLPLRLLSRALHRLGDEQNPARLYDWLDAACYPFWDPPSLTDDSATEIRVWLERRSDVQKAVFLEGLNRCPDDGGFDLCASEVWHRLHGSDPPPDFGLWCLDTAIAAFDENPKIADQLLRQAVHYCDRATGGQGLSKAVLEERTLEHEVLRQRLAELLAPPNIPAPSPPRAADTNRSQIDRERQRWIDLVRDNADALRENRASPRLLFGIGMAYFGHFPFAAPNIASERGLEGVLQSADLVEAAKAGLRGTVGRQDIPEVAEIIQLFVDSRFHPLGPAFLAGMDEVDRAEPDELEGLSALRMRQALAFYYCTPTGRTTDPRWYLRWLDLRPELVADVLVQCAVPSIRGGNEYVPELYQLVRQKSHRRVATYATPRLLASFPLRCSLRQLETLDELLWAALQHADRTALQELLEEKLSCRSLNLAQRIHWLAAGVIMAPGIYLEPLESLVEGKDDRIRKMADFFSPDESLPFLVESLDSRTLQSLINLMGRTFDPMGRTFDPVESAVRVTPEMRASEQVDRLIRRLASLSSDDAAQALDALVDDDALSKWRAMLERVRAQQRVIHRDASYQHPTVDQVRETLSNKAPANAVDLAALLVHSLERLAERIRTSDIDVWKQYWNTGGAYGRPESPRIEADCRDTLLSHLRGVLPIGVIARPEVEYANDRRADIGVSYGGFNVPVGIKRDRDPRLWSALHDQLIAQYTIDPETGGHGVYLVFWFGDGKIPAPPQGRRPTGPAELQQRLEEQLTDSERRRIAVRVMDVSPTNEGR